MHRQKLYSPEGKGAGGRPAQSTPLPPSAPISPTQLQLRTGNASPAPSRSPPAETETHPAAASSAPVQGLSPQTSPPGAEQGHWVKEVLGDGGVCVHQPGLCTHLRKVMDTVQPPRLLPGVCLCPVAGTGTDHPSRKTGDWVREGRRYRRGLAVKEMGIT